MTLDRTEGLEQAAGEMEGGPVTALMSWAKDVLAGVLTLRHAAIHGAGAGAGAKQANGASTSPWPPASSSSLSSPHRSREQQQQQQRIARALRLAKHMENKEKKKRKAEEEGGVPRQKRKREGKSKKRKKERKKLRRRLENGGRAARAEDEEDEEGFDFEVDESGQLRSRRELSEAERLWVRRLSTGLAKAAQPVRERKGRPSLVQEYRRAEAARAAAKAASEKRHARIERELRATLYKRLHSSTVPETFRRGPLAYYRQHVQQRVEEPARIAAESTPVEKPAPPHARSPEAEIANVKAPTAGSAESDRAELYRRAFEHDSYDRRPPSLPPSHWELARAEEGGQEGGIVGPQGERLSEEELAVVEDAWDDEKDPGEELANNVSRSDLMTLRDCEWLNDEVFNFVLDQLNKDLEPGRKPGPGGVWVWNTHFYVKLMGHDGLSAAKQYTYSNVRRWTKRKKINVLNLDRVVVPIHEGVHWTCAVVDLRNKRFDYYDSMALRNEPCLDGLEQWLKDEAKDKAGVDLDTSEWTKTFHQDVPRQDNQFDCGVFALLFARAAARGKAFDFDMRHMPYFRRRLVLDILRPT